MTIANETNKSGPYFYNGAATSFTYGFKISNAAHSRMVETTLATGIETDLVLNTDYTVTGVDADTGNVVISPARAAGKSVVLVRNVPFTQPVVLENQGAYFAKVVEQALDNSVARDQQLAEQISRAVVVPVSADPTDLETLITGVVALLDNVDDVVTVAGISSQVVTVAANVTPISTVAANIVGVQTTAANIAAILAAPALAAAAAADAVATAADRSAVAANKTLVDAAKAAVDVAKAAADADVVLTHADAVATAADRVATAADRVQTGLDRIAAAASAVTAQTFAFAVSYVSQVLTEAQKLIARTNIGAAFKQDVRRNMSVNGSFLVSAENGDTLGTANGYFYADQKVLYRSADLAGKISAQRVAYTSLAGGSKAGEFKCVSTATLISTSLATTADFIEGSDPEFVAAGWGAAGAKPIMVRVECGNVTAGTYSIHVTNRAGNRHCWVPVVVSSGDAAGKVVKEVQIPGDTGGTWSKADGEIGATIEWVWALGSSFVGGTAGVWGSTAYYGGAGQKNFLDNTANVARHTDFGLRLDPDNAGVYGAYRVGEVDATYGPLRYTRPTGALFGVAQTTVRVICEITHIGMCKSPTMISSGVLTFTDYIAVNTTQSSYSVSLTNQTADKSRANIDNFSGMNARDNYGCNDTSVKALFLARLS